MEFFISVTPDFSLSSVLRSHGWIQMLPFATDEQYSWLRYIDCLSTGKVIELLIRQESAGIRLEIQQEVSATEGAEVTARVRWMLNLEQDLSAFYALAESEPKLAHVLDRKQGRILRSSTLFEDVVKTILTTNTIWGGTLRMNKELVNQFGAPLEADAELRAFPTPPQLASLDLETLNGKARLGYRAPYVLLLAQSIANQMLDLESLKTSLLPTPELRKRLLAIKGVGEYAAANLLMLLGRYDFLPVDSWAIKIVSHEWYADQPVGRAEVEAAFERWGEWKGLAFWFWDWDYKG